MQLPPPVASPPFYELAEWWDIVNAVAQTVGAIGTAGALLIGALSYRRQVLERRRDLASHVNFRVAGQGRLVTLVVTNRGELPITATVIVARLAPAEYATWHAFERILAHTVETKDELYGPVYGRHGESTGVIGSVDPGASVTAYQTVPDAFFAQTGGLALALTFADGRGRRWLRLPDGELLPARREPWPKLGKLRRRSTQRQFESAHHRVDLHRRRTMHRRDSGRLRASSIASDD